MERKLTIELIHEPDDTGDDWFVQIVEFPGCMSQGNTIAEALLMIQDAAKGWLKAEADNLKEIADQMEWVQP